jgi:hypothetical protein
MKIINKCKEYAATHLENDNPTPDILYEIAVRVFKRKSLNKQSMINAIKWQPVLVSSNEDENLLNKVKSTFGNPEEEYEKKGLNGLGKLLIYYLRYNDVLSCVVCNTRKKRIKIRFQVM